MMSMIRGGANLALAPVRRLSGLVASAIGALTSTAAVAATATRASADFLRRDRTAPAAALIGIGPLLLDVARDEQSEQCVQQLMALLTDLMAILQREEVATIASAVGHADTDAQLQPGASAAAMRPTGCFGADCCLTSGRSAFCLSCTVQSLSLARSPPVTDLVHHAASTLLALVHVLQTPAVDKVRAQIELYFSCLLGQPLTVSATAPSQSLGQSASAVHDTSQRDLSECVQLLLLIEALSLPILISSPMHSGCQCPTHSAPVQRQRFFGPDEARALRSLARQQDTQLILLHRFTSELKQGQGCASGPSPSLNFASQTTHTSMTAPSGEARFRSLSLSGRAESNGAKEKSQRRSHSASEMPQRDSAHCEWGRPVDYSSGSGTGGGSGAMSDSAAEQGSPQAPEQSMPSLRSVSNRDRLVQRSNFGSMTSSAIDPSKPPSSLYAHPRQRGPSFAAVHQAAARARQQQEEAKTNAEARALQRRLDKSEADEHAAQWSGSDDGEEAEDGDEEQMEGGRRNSSQSSCQVDHSSSSASSSPILSATCPHHVPLQHARFVFCAREMLMERHSDTAQ